MIQLSLVDIPEEGCGLNDIDKFQQYLTQVGIAIVVYSFRDFAQGESPPYDGKNFVIYVYSGVKYIIRIMYYERLRHFEPILNLVGAAGSHRYCIPCNKSNDRFKNNRCSATEVLFW